MLSTTPRRFTLHVLLGLALALPVAAPATAVPLDPWDFDPLPRFSSYLMPDAEYAVGVNELTGKSGLFWRYRNFDVPWLHLAPGVVHEQTNGGPDIVVLCFDSLEVPAGTKIRVIGRHPVALLSRGSIYFAGHLVARSYGRVAVGGGHDGGNGGSTGSWHKTVPGQNGWGWGRGRYGRFTGGGGGFGGRGTAAYLRYSHPDHRYQGRGGTTYGDLFHRLQGGSGGASGAGKGPEVGTYRRFDGGDGGAGGGAVELGALAKVVIEGRAIIDARGTNGGNSESRYPGAGGAGGGILVHGYAVQIRRGAKLLAGGGRGGVGKWDYCDRYGWSGGDGGGGRILLAYVGAPEETGIKPVTPGAILDVSGARGGCHHLSRPPHTGYSPGEDGVVETVQFTR